MTKSLSKFKQFEKSIDPDAVIGVHLPSLGINSVPTDLANYISNKPGCYLEGNKVWFSDPDKLTLGGESG